MGQNEDRRVRKTKKAMTDALSELLLKKPLKNISVREISELADINRGTFYLHYRDVYDMAEQLENEIFDRFNDIVLSHEKKGGTDELLPMLVDLLNLLQENSGLAKVLTSKHGDAAFVDKLKNVILDKCFANIQHLLQGKESKDCKYFYHYTVSGCLGICSAWLSNGMEESPYEMASLCEKLILKDFNVLC